MKSECRKIWNFYMIIKTIIKFMGQSTKKLFNLKSPTINYVKARSTLIGRKKVIYLKKIGEEKRNM